LLHLCSAYGSKGLHQAALLPKPQLFDRCSRGLRRLCHTTKQAGNRSHMARTPRQQSGGQSNLLLAAACAALGFVGGWSFGHVHGLHACDSNALGHGKIIRPCSPQPRAHLIHQEANRTRHALDDALIRLSKLERSTTKCPKCQSASEAISQIEELENQVRDLTSSHESKGGEASLDMTQWASVRAFDRARLWRETLASWPYVLGTTISRGGLLFTKRKPLNASLAAAKATCSEIDVVVADSKPDVCLAVFDSRLPIYTMLRTDASGGKVLEKQRLVRFCVARPLRSASLVPAAAAARWRGGSAPFSWHLTM
jgi:hypothetical protein